MARTKEKKESFKAFNKITTCPGLPRVLLFNY